MRTNNLRTIWQSGGAAVNGWLAIPNSFATEVTAHQGWDTLTIDLQHGVVDYQAMVTMLQAISTTQTVPIVRVPWLEPGIIMKTLDANHANISLSNKMAITDIGQLDVGLAATELSGYSSALQATYKAYAKIGNLSLFDAI